MSHDIERAKKRIRRQLESEERARADKSLGAMIRERGIIGDSEEIATLLGARMAWQCLCDYCEHHDKEHLTPSCMLVNGFAHFERCPLLNIEGRLNNGR